VNARGGGGVLGSPNVVSGVLKLETNDIIWHSPASDPVLWSWDCGRSNDMRCGPCLYSSIHDPPPDFQAETGGLIVSAPCHFLPGGMSPNLGAPHTHVWL